ncbi:MAG: SPOR domain-containing protein [Porphyrobacter sp.]|nr:SPOR domain-containing protein [Porphyrobacter sp.]
MPSRHWLQVATGRDAEALAWDWRRIKRQADGLLDDATPHLAAWGESTRLLAGPFSAREVQQLITQLKAKAIDTFRFTSAAGQEVRPLP